jgi:hypothetical protein
MTAALNPTTHFVPHHEVIESRLGEETVMLHLGKAVYFGLDAVGTIVWERLQEGDTLAEICGHVRAAFADAPDTLEADVTGFIAELLAKELIEPRQH